MPRLTTGIHDWIGKGITDERNSQNVEQEFQVSSDVASLFPTSHTLHSVWLSYVNKQNEKVRPKIRSKIV